MYIQVSGSKTVEGDRRFANSRGSAHRTGSLGDCLFAAAAHAASNAESKREAQRARELEEERDGGEKEREKRRKLEAIPLQFSLASSGEVREG